MASWWLQDSYGRFHQARFLRVTPINVLQMQWTTDLLWSNELAVPSREVYKLVDEAEDRIQGGISISDADDHIYIHLLEAAPHNRYRGCFTRIFVNVARLLIAFAGGLSNIYGCEGFLALTPKTNLVSYYRQKFRAFDLPQRKMGIDGVVSNHWIKDLQTNRSRSQLERRIRRCRQIGTRKAS
ncbi:hypothetical protein B5M42_010515 [Paenibacillus athensensis]|uniref:hypothetical protein n=1 Tax=Paenibacillus athensensis TaxID=1967502 RepID=UPI00106FCC5F|nr:hypothetical protein [Paenibacillus athensensis]MCD1259270.1 hypothetical protein [Paenibacillus athensensis]